MDNLNRENVTKLGKEYMGDKTKQPIVGMFVLLIASFLFYILSAIFAALGGSGRESTNVLERGNIAELGQASAADAFSKIQMALRIMPSHKTEGNLLLMLPFEGDAEWQGDYDGDFAGTISDNFFATDNMEDYFPDMLFNEHTVPIGNAKPFCMHFDWSTKANRKIMDMYYSV